MMLNQKIGKKIQVYIENLVKSKFVEDQVAHL